MVVGICRIELHIPESRSLKDKRQVIKGIKDKIRNKFNVSIAEIGNNDLWQRASLGVSIISNDKKFATQVLCLVVDKINQENGAVILDHNIEFV
ncbi:MAG: DUF503 domain-containing protein [candidate division Zixibacteria bacterium]|nr:DUF503 domain-containing protein [candidate division Zixibacteria bacterium]